LSSRYAVNGCYILMVTFSFFFIFSGITPPVNEQGTIAA
jgi:hypothetical protein